MSLDRCPPKACSHVALCRKFTSTTPLGYRTFIAHLDSEHANRHMLPSSSSSSSLPSSSSLQQRPRPQRRHYRLGDAGSSSVLASLENAAADVLVPADANRSAKQPTRRRATVSRTAKTTTRTTTTRSAAVVASIQNTKGFRSNLTDHGTRTTTSTKKKTPPGLIASVKGNQQDISDASSPVSSSLASPSSSSDEDNGGDDDRKGK